MISVQPFSAASLTKSDQRRGGMPRARQVLMVEAGKFSAAETAPVPPRASIASSAVSAMDASIVRRLRTCQAFADCAATSSWNFGSIEEMADALEMQKKRLKATRIACGAPTQKAFYDAIGISKSGWSEFENGKRPLTLEAARKLKAGYKIPLDWSLDGDVLALDIAPAYISRKLTNVA